MEAQGVAMMMRGRFCNTHMRGGICKCRYLVHGGY